MKRFASHFLYLSSGNCLKQHVVELKNGCACRIFPLAGETESTLWVGGTIILSAPAAGNVFVDAEGYIQSELPVYAYQVLGGNLLKRLQ